MAKWHFWGEKSFADVYENIYIRTKLEDWFKIVFSIVGEINYLGGKKTILEIGCGEGHTTKQILDRIKGDYICDILEPDKNALNIGKAFLKSENKIGEIFETTLANLKTNKKYGIVFTSHTNYYWAVNKKDYDEQLKKLTFLVKDKGKIMILTLPEKSDHYNIAVRKTYPEYNYAEYIENFYKKSGLKVNVKRFKMRMFVGDILSTNSRFDLKTFYRFVHNTESYPSDSESDKFLHKIKKFQKDDCLDFKDELIIAEN